jgi:mono/diheme cytochrome c family protein
MNQNLKIAGMTLLGLSLAVPALAQQSGEAIYKSKCAMCHGVDGSANTPMGRNMKIRSLKSPEDIKASDATLFKQTKEGVGRMPAYAGKLTDAQIRAVVAHIRRLQK